MISASNGFVVLTPKGFYSALSVGSLNLFETSFESLYSCVVDTLFNDFIIDGHINLFSDLLLVSLVHCPFYIYLFFVLAIISWHSKSNHTEI